MRKSLLGFGLLASLLKDERDELHSSTEMQKKYVGDLRIEQFARELEEGGLDVWMRMVSIKQRSAVHRGRNRGAGIEEGCRNIPPVVEASTCRFTAAVSAVSVGVEGPTGDETVPLPAHIRFAFRASELAAGVPGEAPHSQIEPSSSSSSFVCTHFARFRPRIKPLLLLRHHHPLLLPQGVWGTHKSAWSSNDD